jgi:hypothetical protein
MAGGTPEKPKTQPTVLTIVTIDTMAPACSSVPQRANVQVQIPRPPNNTNSKEI